MNAKKEYHMLTDLLKHMAVWDTKKHIAYNKYVYNKKKSLNQSIFAFLHASFLKAIYFMLV